MFQHGARPERMPARLAQRSGEQPCAVVGALGHLPPECFHFARGPIVVLPDLLSALNSGRLSQAVLDVFDEEPLPATSPFWAHPNVTVLPHVSAPTDLTAAAKVVADNIGRFRRGEHILGVVDSSRGY